MHASWRPEKRDRWLRSVLENSSEVYKVVDPDGTLRYASPAFEKVLGYDLAEAAGKMNVLDHVHPDDLPRVLAEAERALSEGRTVSNKAEYRFRHKDGSWRWVESVGTYLLDDPAVRGVVVSVRDVTRRKEAEQKLHVQAQLLGAVGEAVIALDAEGRVVFWNRAAEEMYGWSDKEAMGRSLMERVVPEDLRSQAEEIMAGVRSGRNWKGEFVVRRKDGTLLTVEATNTPVFGENGGRVGVVGVLRDVTERREIEEALRRSEAELFSVLESITDGFFLADREWRFAYVNRQAALMLNRDREDLVGERLWEDDTFYPEYRRAVAEGKTVEFEGYYAPLKRWYGVRAYPSQSGLSVYFQDVTERKVVEVALRESEERYRALMEQSVEAIYLFDAETKRVLESNAAFGKLMGYAEGELLGMRIYDFVAHPREDIDRNVRRSLEERRRHIGERRYRRKDGSLIVVDTSASVISYGGRKVICAVSRDVTERKEAEEALRRSEARLAEAQRLAHLGNWEWDVKNDEITWSDEVYRIYGLEPQEFAPGFERFMGVVHPDDRDRVRKTIDEALEGSGPYDVEHRVVRPDGEVRTVQRRAEVMRGDGGEPLRMIGTVHDITERKEAEERQRAAEERYRTVVEEQTELVCRFLPDLIVTFANEAYCRYFGLTPEEVVGSSFLERVPVEDRVYYEGLPAWLNEENPRRTIEHRVLTPDGGVRWQQWTDTAIFDDQGRVVEYQSVGRDVTERRALEERLEHQALHDSLTGLPNRRLFVDRLGQALRRTTRKQNRVAILFMDLDGFKVVNDSIGHDTGDRLLVEVAKRVGGCLRPEDTLARFGGDEFTILIEDVEVPDGAVRVAERIVEELREPFSLNGRELYVAASIGVALGSDGTKDAGKLLREADTAMYRAKDEGSGHKVFDPAMHGRALGRLELENDLRRAIEEDEFVVHYQPIVGLQTGQLWGMEALVRWEHPERGLLNPDEFVPVAEESGLVVPMGELVLEEACRRAVEWQRESPRTPPLAVSVNLSGRQLRRPDLPGVIGRALTESGLPASSLGLDITETVYIGALDANTAALDRLRALGIRVSLDDFGSGYSSLSYLKRLPADILKVDKSFTRGLGVEVEDTAIVQTVVDLAHILGMEVVAEGVEVEEQETLLREMGCDFAQGYHFSRPLTPEAVSKFLTY